jgi:predicted HTH transcriptional regulator
MYPAELEQLIRQGETQDVEFKSSIPAPQDIAKHVAAFANTNGGQLILGVKEPGEIVGINEQQARAAIEQAQQYLSPVPATTVLSPNIHGRVVVVVQVAASEELHSALGGYFGRAARPTAVLEAPREATRPLNLAEIRLHALKGKTADAALSRLATAVADQTRTSEKQTDDRQAEPGFREGKFVMDQACVRVCRHRRGGGPYALHGTVVEMISSQRQRRSGTISLPETVK